MGKRISVITVCRNAEKLIESTIRSVLQQNYDSIEYIIIDGASTDGTLDIIKCYEQNISKWMSEKDSGIYAAMNKGLDMATGDIVCFMNAGDRFADSEVLEKIALHAEKCRDAALIYGHVVWYSDDDVDFKVLATPNVSIHSIKRGTMPCHQAQFYLGEALSLRFDEKINYIADYDLFCRIIKRFGVQRTYYCPQLIAEYLADGKSGNVHAFWEKTMLITTHWGYVLGARYFVMDVLFALICRVVLNIPGVGKTVRVWFRRLRYAKIRVGN